MEGGVDWAFAVIEHNVAIAATMTVLGIVTPLIAMEWTVEVSLVLVSPICRCVPAVTYLDTAPALTPVPQY